MKNIAYIDGQNFMHRVADVLTEAIEKSIKFAQSLRRLRGYLSKTEVKYIPKARKIIPSRANLPKRASRINLSSLTLMRVF